MTISEAQARAARAYLKLEGTFVAEQTGISVSPLYRFEAEGRGISKEKLALLQKFYEGKGIEFLEYGGIRPRPKSTILQLEGEEGFRIFMGDVLDVAETQGGDITVSGVNEREFEKWMGDFLPTYLKKMAEVRKEMPFHSRILVSEEDDYYIATEYAEYRKVKKEYFAAAPFYVYGDRLALIAFEPDDVSVFIIQNRKLAEAQIKQFNLVWDSVK